MKAFVTGATGFLGGRVIDSLVAANASIRCFVRKSSDLTSFVNRKDGAEINISCGNMSDYESCLEAMQGCDTVFHIAAELKGSTAVLFMANVVATRVLIKAALASKIKRFVLVSSLGVYGPHKIRSRGVLDETCPIDSKPAKRDSYSYSKIIQESVCWDAYRDFGLPLVVVRPGVIYGPGRDLLTTRVGLKLGNFLLIMGGKQVLPYVHVVNCADGVALAGSVSGIDGKAFNLVDDDLPTGKQLVRRFRSEVGGVISCAIPRYSIGLLSRFNEWYHRVSRGQIPLVFSRHKSEAMWKQLQYSNASAKLLLRWNPRISSQQGIDETLSWLRDNRDLSKGK